MNVAPTQIFRDRNVGHTSEQGSAKLQRLSEEVNRIASILACLAAPASAPRPSKFEAVASNVSPETVRAVIRARRLRGSYFADELFADPAWDMLLDLFHAELTQLRVSVSSVCIAAAVPATTALRWLKALTDKGLVHRRSDPYDGRRVYVELSPQTSLAMQSYFAEIGKMAVV